MRTKTFVRTFDKRVFDDDRQDRFTCQIRISGLRGINILQFTWNHSPSAIGLANWPEWLAWSHECFAAIDAAEGAGTVHKAAINTVILNNNPLHEISWGDIAETWNFRPPPGGQSS